MRAARSAVQGAARAAWGLTALVAVAGLGFLTYGSRPATVDEAVAAGARYLTRAATLPVGLVLVTAAAGSVVAAVLDRRRVAAPGLSDRPALSPLAIVDATVASAVREMLVELTAALRRSLRPSGDDGEPDVVTFVDLLIKGGIRLGASDIHLHPVEAGTQISFRIHGVLEDVLTFPRVHHSRLITRLKVLGRLVIFRNDRPQDGHFSVDSPAGVADIRISVLPTNHGEKVVLRISRVGLEVPELAALGFPAELAIRYRELLRRPQGVVFLTGPTGSGKTTTIYSSLAHIKQSRGETTHIATIEDPVEFDVPFLTQTQVSTEAGLTFAQGLRSILRQDPNVIMVGEIRDAETAHIAVQAGLTGHQIVTTVHADSAAGVFNRLIEMGVEPFLLASASLACLSQRLVRALCPHCRVPAAPTPDELVRLRAAGLPQAGFFGARGCKRCDGSGFLGRTALYELLVVSPAIRELINDKVPTPRIHAAALADGMRPLLAAGIERAGAGATSLSEVLRVVG
jgi:general secretion pathway protein E